MLSRRTLLLLHGALLVAQCGAIGLLARESALSGGFPLDDAWIHQVIARAFVRTGVLGADGQLHGAGVTSPLWAVLQAPNHAWLHLAPSLYCALLNIPLHIATGHLVLRLLCRDGWSAAIALGAAVLFSTSSNAVWFAFSGMEATLLVFLGVLAIAIVTSARASSHLRCALAGLALAGLTWVRTDAVFFVPLLLLVAWRLRYLLRDLALLAFPAALSLAVYAYLNWINTGHLSPATLGGRRWLWLHPFDGMTRLQLAAHFLGDWAGRLTTHVLSVPTDSPALFWIALGLAAVGIVAAVRHRSVRLLILFAWMALQLATYAALLPSIGHGGRYQPLVPSVFLLLVGLGCAAMLSRVRASQSEKNGVRTLLEVTAIVPFVVTTIGSLHAWSVDEACAVEHVNYTELGMGDRIRSLPADARIASFDIGGIAYAAGRPVLDLGGLSDADTAPLLYAGRIWERLAAHRIDYVVLPLFYDDGDIPHVLNFGERLGLFRNEHVHLEQVSEIGSPPELWIPGVTATWNCAPRQVLYKISFSEAQP